jgi:hypothetical protein
MGLKQSQSPPPTSEEEIPDGLSAICHLPSYKQSSIPRIAVESGGAFVQNPQDALDGGISPHATEHSQMFGQSLTPPGRLK